MDRAHVANGPRRRGAFVPALLVVGALDFQLPLAPGQVTRFAVLFFAVWSLCMAALMERSRGGIYRPSAMYMLVFGLFHGGLLVSVALRGPDGLENYDSTWIYSVYTPQVVHLVVIGMVSFTLATLLSGGLPQQSGTTRPPTEQRQRKALGAVGLGLEVVGLAIFWAQVAAAGGLSLLSGGYSVFAEASASHMAAGYGTLFVGVGAVCAVVAGGRNRLLGWAGFAAYALVAFPIGNRGEVLFPLAVLLVADARCGRRPRKAAAALAGLAILVGIGIVRNSRVTGYRLPTPTDLFAAPFNAVAEMGASLRPSVVVTDWHAFGEPYRHGVTLVAVPLRFLERVTGWHGGPPAYDDRLFNSEILHRVGPIGGSPVAEAYHNAGTVGVVVVMALLGLVVGWLDRRPGTLLGDARLILLVPLFVQVRNSFAPVPVELAIGAAILWLVQVCSDRRVRASGIPKGVRHDTVADEHPIGAAV